MKSNIDINVLVILLWLGLIALGLTILSIQPRAAVMMTPEGIAVLHPTEGNKVNGTVKFVNTMEGIQITANLTGMNPGRHGFHIHQWGDCSAPDASSAGGHYDPFNKRHGGPQDDQRHVGDLGNITAQSDGRGHLDMIDKVISLEGPNSIIGRAVVVHAGEDDLVSQPSGNAGNRLACGVIGYDQ